MNKKNEFHQSKLNFIKNNFATIAVTTSFIIINVCIFLYYYQAENISKQKIQSFEEIAKVIDIKHNIYPSILISSKSTNNIAQEIPIRIFNCQLDPNLINKEIHITVHKKYRSYNDSFYYYFPSLEKFCNKKIP